MYAERQQMKAIDAAVTLLRDIIFVQFYLNYYLMLQIRTQKNMRSEEPHTTLYMGCQSDEMNSIILRTILPHTLRPGAIRRAQRGAVRVEHVWEDPVQPP